MTADDLVNHYTRPLTATILKSANIVVRIITKSVSKVPILSFNILKLKSMIQKLVPNLVSCRNTINPKIGNYRWIAWLNGIWSECLFTNHNYIQYANNSNRTYKQRIHGNSCLFLSKISWLNDLAFLYFLCMAFLPLRAITCQRKPLLCWP